MFKFINFFSANIDKIIIGKAYEFSNGIFKLGVDIKALKRLIDDINRIK